MSKKIVIGFVLLFLSIDGYSQFQWVREDNIKALRYLFKRKKKGGIARAIVFSGLAAVVATSSTTPYPQSQNRSTYGYNNDFVSSEPSLASNIFVASVLGGFAISGIVQVEKYSNKNLNKVIESVRNGKGIPKPYQHLMPKDYREKKNEIAGLSLQEALPVSSESKTENVMDFKY